MKRALMVVVAVVVVFSAGCFLALTPDGLAVGVSPVITTGYSYIPGTRIQTVPSAPGVLYYGNYYWRFSNGTWWRSSSYNAGWSVYHSVPSAFLHIPTSHPAYRYVRYHPQFKLRGPSFKGSSSGFKLPVRSGSHKKGGVLRNIFKKK